MGKTYKDQNKYERKRRQRDGDEDMFRSQKRHGKKHTHYEEIIPDEDELDPYEHLDYDDYR